MASAVWMTSSVRGCVVVSATIIVSSSSVAVTSVPSSAEVSHHAAHGVA